MILRLADSKRMQLVGIWVPREKNAFADYLSHLINLKKRTASQGNRGRRAGNQAKKAGQRFLRER